MSLYGNISLCQWNPSNIRKETCCFFSCEHPRCWESRIQWLYGNVFLIPGSPKHQTLLYGEILTNSKLFSCNDYNVHHSYQIPQDMTEHTSNVKDIFLYPKFDKLLQHLKRTRLIRNEKERSHNPAAPVQGFNRKAHRGSTSNNCRKQEKNAAVVKAILYE